MTKDIKQIITIKAVPPSNNKFIGRENRWEYQRVKKEWLMLVRNAINTAGIPSKCFEKAKVEILYTFPDRRRRDPDNYSGKMILDALTTCGIIKDDSFDVIDLSIKAAYEKGVERTTITVTGGGAGV